MNVTIEMPEEVAAKLELRNGQDLPRTLLELIALEGYRSGRLAHAEVMRLMGFEHRLQVDAFFKEHEVPSGYSPDDLEDDLRTLAALHG